jgi:hypothetical protein
MACSLIWMSAWTYICVLSTDSWPNQNAMTVRSTLCVRADHTLTFCRRRRCITRAIALAYYSVDVEISIPLMPALKLATNNRSVGGDCSR